MDDGVTPEILLEDYGYSAFFSDALARHHPELAPARVVLASSSSFRVITAEGELDAKTTGRIRHAASDATELPAMGDWVGLAEDRIEWILPRRTRLSRKSPGKKTREQIVAANVDQVVIMMGLDNDYSERRLERYLTTVWDSGASPIVLLNKADLAADFEDRREAIDALSGGVPVIAASLATGLGVEAVEKLLLPRETAVLMGSSGVGKSTLINRLLGTQAQKTREVRARDERGQHTTTHRELFVLPGGALLIDNPGIRELQLWADESALEQSFDDIRQLADGCRFRDCSHEAEPGCAVMEALSSGTLASERLESYRSLQEELRYLRIRQDESAQRAEKQKWREIHKAMRKTGKHRRT